MSSPPQEPNPISLKRPATVIKISNKKRCKKIGIKLKNNNNSNNNSNKNSNNKNKNKNKNPNIPTSTLSTTSNSGSNSTSIFITKKLPSILTKDYHTLYYLQNKNERKEQEQQSVHNNNINNNNDDNNNNDIDDDTTYTKLLEQFIQQTDNDNQYHEIILAIKLLTNQYAAAICQLHTNNYHYHQDTTTTANTKNNTNTTTNTTNTYANTTIATNTTHTNHQNYITFVLKPMIKAVLNHTMSSKNNKRSRQIASEYISTEFNIDLEKLDLEHKIRLIQLHGMTNDDDDDGGGENNNKKNYNSKKKKQTTNNSHYFATNDDENVAVLLFNDYVMAVNDAALFALQQQQEKKNSSSTSTNYNDDYDNNNINVQVIVKLFLDCIYNHGCHGRFVSVTKLEKSLKSAWIKNNHDQQQQSLSSTFTPIKCEPEKWIEILVQIQLLLPRLVHNSQTSCTTSYWYTLPNMGMAAKIISEGRKKMIHHILRSYHKEVKRNVLEKINFHLRRSGPCGKQISCMTSSFHVRDFLARDVVKLVHRPSGDFIRLTTY